MKIIAKGFSHKLGFTLVEMLMAIAIIAVLVSLIIPALSLVHKSADMVRQKSQFHSIGVGLEAFRADFGDYPESDSGVIPTIYPGAQKLAEAMIGHDGFGFHPDSIFDRDGEDESGISLYKPEVDDYIESLGLPPDEEKAMKRENLTIRKGPYLELETANAVRLNNLYNGTPFMSGDRYVLADMFGLVKNKATGKKTGMPIFYYRANTSNFVHDPANYSADLDGNIYDYRDNDRIALLTQLWDRTVSHPMSSSNPEPYGPRIFYENTLNPNFDVPLRPYRSDSFILLSAGPDGLYGTVDDVFNFERAE